jgi:hypothetical protein
MNRHIALIIFVIPLLLCAEISSEDRKSISISPALALITEGSSLEG